MGDQQLNLLSSTTIPSGSTSQAYGDGNSKPQFIIGLGDDIVFSYMETYSSS